MAHCFSANTPIQSHGPGSNLGGRPNGPRSIFQQRGPGAPVKIHFFSAVMFCWIVKDWYSPERLQGPGERALGSLALACLQQKNERQTQINGRTKKLTAMCSQRPSPMEETPQRLHPAFLVYTQHSSPAASRVLPVVCDLGSSLALQPQFAGVMLIRLGTLGRSWRTASYGTPLEISRSLGWPAHGGGGGCDSSHLDANYPPHPPTNRGPEAP